MIRQWRHLKSLKRSGRGHDKTGASGTKNGELCIQCPACPRPSVNLPDNWEDMPDDMKYVLFSTTRPHSHVRFRRFLYTLVLAIDANFRLRRRAVSSDERDPALGDGWGYFVQHEPYVEHILKHAKQDDVCRFKLLIISQN